ncbi:MAG: hypothetical protein HOP13_06460 [Alphaproteobacteria bacterium]|nr:hypothetical protein [Alphaproteobacteria bacterium]
MMLVRSAVIMFATTALAAGALGAPLRIVAHTACANDVTVCVEMNMHWDFARTDKPPIGADGMLAVRGRLGKGEVEAYRLALSTLPSAGLDLGEVAYLGRSHDGLPVIMTDKGPLTVETRGVHVGRGGAVVIVNTKARGVKRYYMGGLAGATYVIAGASRIGVLTKRGACLSPPMARPGALKTVAHCGSGAASPATGLAFSEPLAGAITPAPDADLALIRKLLPQTADFDDETLRTKIGRIDKEHLVVTPW